MNLRWVRFAVSAVVLLAAVNFLSCGNQRRLVSIEIQPSGALFRTPDSMQEVVFTARGTYKHPPDTRDITGQVTWRTDTPTLLQVTKGIVSPKPGGVCGVGDIYADLNDSGNLKTAFATITVNDPTRSICPGGGTTQGVVSVGILPATDDGSVTSAPAGIACPSGACITQFPVGSTVGLNAVPSSGHTFVGWTGGCTGSQTTCSFTVPTGSTNVTATFN